MHADNTLRGEGNPLSDVVVKREVRQLNSLDPMRIFFILTLTVPEIHISSPIREGTSTHQNSGHMNDNHM